MRKVDIFGLNDYEDVESFYPPDACYFFAPKSPGNMNRDHEAIYDETIGAAIQFFAAVSAMRFLPVRGRGGG
ncbi:MAG: hypothetical protein KKH12_04215 [Gammaproteobacteria bacterium]|nr:hypothetical protein [Gammaproteobacteria bacterium]MBU1480863.1 hypothetical protein [Gammaproteobacteria bacterium]